MEKITTVLAALDLEDGSNVVLARAAQLASAHAAWLVALHVIDAEPLSHAAAHMKLGEIELREELRRQAIAEIEPLIVGSGRMQRTDIRVEFGSAHEIITQVARDRLADIIVLGPGKGHTLKGKFLGSTADRVIRMAAAPVLVVRKPLAEPYRRVAVALDASPHSARAFCEVRRLTPDANIQMVHAVDVPFAFQQAMLRAGTSQAEVVQYRAARGAKARAELSTFQRDSLGVPGLPVKILDGEPGPALVGFSKRAKIDLLALGSHGRSAGLQTLLGSVARRVLGEAACDVLVTNIRQ